MKAKDLKSALMDAKTASRFCGVGLTLWKQLNITGRAPEPIHLNSKVFWSTRQLELWAITGCPSRDSETWQTIIKKYCDKQ